MLGAASDVLTAMRTHHKHVLLLEWALHLWSVLAAPARKGMQWQDALTDLGLPKALLTVVSDHSLVVSLQQLAWDAVAAFIAVHFFSTFFSNLHIM